MMGFKPNKDELLGRKYTNKNVKKSRFIGNNTLRIELVDGTEIIRYYYTDIITIKPDKTAILSTGAHHTRSTITRLNEFYFYKNENRPFSRIYTKNYELLFNYKGEPALFYDGITFDKDGNILSMLLRRPVKQKINFHTRFKKKLGIAFDDVPKENELIRWYWNKKPPDRRKFKGKLKTLIKHSQKDKFGMTEDEKKRLVQIHKTIFE